MLKMRASESVAALVNTHELDFQFYSVRYAIQIRFWISI